MTKGRPRNSKKRKQYNFTSKSQATTAPKKKRYQWNNTPVPGASIHDSQGIRDQRGRTPHNSMAKAFKLIHAEEQKIKDAAFNKRMGDVQSDCGTKEHFTTLLSEFFDIVESREEMETQK